MNRYFIVILLSLALPRNLEVEFVSDQQWILGVPWVGGTDFNGGINVGSPVLYGQSTLSELDVADIDVHFTSNTDMHSQCLVMSNSMDGSEIGVGSFPGFAMDVSDPLSPRRLNIVFFEGDGNLEWDPLSVSGQDREYFIVMSSDYDNSGLFYQGHDPINMDVQYFSWVKKNPTLDWFASEPAILEFRNYWELSEYHLYSSSNQIRVEWAHENPAIENESVVSYEITRTTNLDSSIIGQVGLGVNHYTDENLINYEPYTYQVIGYGSSGEVLVISPVSTNYPSPNEYNTELVSNWNGGNDYQGTGPKYNDIWGYTDLDGVEYALIGTWDGVHIIDITTDPDNPTETSFVPGSYSSHRDIKTFSHYMYVGTEANYPDPSLYPDEYVVYSQGIQVIDISDPYSPLVISEWDGVVQSHNIMDDSGYLYVIGSNDLDGPDGDVSWALDDLIILSLENPAAPEKIGGWTGNYLHDVCISGDTLFGCSIYTDEMIAFDISDKSNPTIISRWFGIPKSHACWVSDDGETLFTASETTGGHIMSWDVSNLDNVELLDEWYPIDGENWSAHNPFYKDGYLYISYYVYGLEIVDVSVPSYMAEAGYYDTFTEYIPGAIFNGAWGTYPYFNSGKIVISDRSTGLHVVTFSPDQLNVELGDLNQDNSIDILDVIFVVNIIMGTENPSEYQSWSADMNADQIIDILDIIVLVGQIIE